MKRCVECGRQADEYLQNNNGEPLCDDCFFEFYDICSQCGGAISVTASKCPYCFNETVVRQLRDAAETVKGDYAYFPDITFFGKGKDKQRLDAGELIQYIADMLEI